MKLAISARSLMGYIKVVWGFSSHDLDVSMHPFRSMIRRPPFERQARQHRGWVGLRSNHKLAISAR